MADQKSVKDEQYKLFDDTVKFCREVQRQYTGPVFAHKMAGFTFSTGSVYPMEKEGGTWRFENKLGQVWGEFYENVAPELGHDIIKMKEATALSFALLNSGVEPVVRRGLVVFGGTRSGSPQAGGEPAPTAPASDEGGGGGNLQLLWNRCVVRLRLLRLLLPRV
jgi:hypothetical protein